MHFSYENAGNDTGGHPAISHAPHLRIRRLGVRVSPGALQSFRRDNQLGCLALFFSTPSRQQGPVPQPLQPTPDAQTIRGELVPECIAQVLLFTRHYPAHEHD